MPSETPLRSSSSMFEWAVSFAERVVERSREPLAGVDSLHQVLMGMVYHVAQRLIDAKRITGDSLPSDEALILLCNKLFNDMFAGFLLVKRGMIGPATYLLRSSLEVTNLAILVGGNAEHARRWLAGHEYSPGDVRRLLESSDDERQWYRKLSKDTHANYVATRMSTYWVAERNTHVLLYGGRFAPKEAGLTACAFLWVSLTFLNAFYARNSPRLASLNLLWKPAASELLGDLPPGVEVGWKAILEVLGGVLAEIQEGLEALPNDHADIPDLVAELLDDMPQDGSAR